MAEKIAIEARGLTKVYGFRKRVVAVENLDMRIEKGTIYGFIGPNGAGKTTTIKMLVGAIRPTRGEAYIFGEPVGSVRAKSYIGYSPEHPNFYSMHALDFLIYIGTLYGLPKDEAKGRAEELLELFGLENSADKNALTFSAGMKQKLSLAQALIADPEILILDEPTANLDPIGRYEVLKNIEELARKEKGTVFISSHILLELEKIIDHVTIIDRGKVILQSSMADLKRRFSENHFVIDVSDNRLLLDILKKDENVTKVWVNHEGKIEVMVRDGKRFKEKALEIFRTRRMELNEFYPYKISLENIFLKLLSNKSGDGE
ncbi:MAG: ABC transporter ATP-binding protein [Candidatus Aenigmatarchaeota archaeon]|nr:MAG: ABC transporter ATP-binding protein [Candidatus Aenigmarchaeota archaeon]